MLGRLVIALSVVVTSRSSLASECLRIEAPLDRLACYDKENGRTGTVETKPTVPSNWIVQTEKSKLTDDVGHFLTVDAKEPITCRFGQSERPYLQLRCKENKTALILYTGCHMASSDYHTWGHVEYRVDDKPSKLAKMDASTSNTALGLWSGGRAIPVIKQMIGGKTLILRYIPYNENAIISEFDISGLGEVISPLRSQCKW